MFIKVDANGNILAHNPTSLGDINIEIADQILISFEEVLVPTYKYKYVNNSLVELTVNEMLAHPVRIANKLNVIRYERNQRLAECDFIIMSDSPASESCKASFVTYRQALRDLTEDIDVDDFTWPTKPEYVKA